MAPRETPPAPDPEREPRRRVPFYRGLLVSTLVLLLASSVFVYLWAIRQITLGEKLAR